MKNFIIRKNFIGERLDKYLTVRMEITRSQIKKLINSNGVLVNKKVPSTHQFLKPGDRIAILGEEQRTEPEKLASNTRKILEPQIIYDCEDYFIINKPAGMLVHPTRRQEKNTLIDWLLKKYPALAKVGEDPARPALVHRLDKEVSGLMIIPRNLNSFDFFKAQFKQRTIKKEYLALVHGVLANEAGELTFPIARSKDGKFIAQPIGSEDGKSAITNYKIKKRFLHYTLLHVQPKTGRTNQIRIHLNAITHPIVGDTLYTSRKVEQRSKLKLNRVFLHASRLIFIDMNGQEKVFEASLPKQLTELLNNLT
ncbi:hypothetical protein A2223_02935 [Candidatus Falkowbacteria bacterium RIFOXYA2_FULL_35_8]|uniref:Pseudouridine synthase n=1 Tax=Candidatus Falkowbacteria bacterium RIFOXYC2_FULL_36_12 TaxID=1798002 RepID=A0A1F5T0B9_9BACT|nr:MAG: hypothetical protein A2478_05535 [Candidatus Falkowbacteria bacterium RIFOXYC2_FULL_36_12]OGF34673.1 MAG: hypothetical protein A2223_02935 [Candidatus Falkowbacteria bacterium RIFOXYA2_FULL_35_8]